MLNDYLILEIDNISPELYIQVQLCLCCILGNIEHWVLAIFISRDMKCIEMTDNRKVGNQKWNDGKFIKNKIFETYQKM